MHELLRGRLTLPAKPAYSASLRDSGTLDERLSFGR
jgi:hypothetical protein